MGRGLVSDGGVSGSSTQTRPSESFKWSIGGRTKINRHSFSSCQISGLNAGANHATFSKNRFAYCTGSGFKPATTSTRYNSRILVSVRAQNVFSTFGSYVHFTRKPLWPEPPQDSASA